MDAKLSPAENRCGETVAHLCLKRLALLWAQARGYSACGVEVSLPRCRFRADVAAYRAAASGGVTAIFECKQALVDLRRDNCRIAATRERLDRISRRRQILEKMLRVHYPGVRAPDSLFAEFDSYNFAAINHHGYSRLLRHMTGLQNRLFDCTKFETLLRYRCANLHFLVLPNELFRESEIPIGWGALVETDGHLIMAQKALWQDVAPENELRLLHRIAAAGTRLLNQQIGLGFQDIVAARAKS